MAFVATVAIPNRRKLRALSERIRRIASTGGKAKMKNKTSWAVSLNDETDDGDFIYRHHAGKPHPCEFSCNGSHPLNRDHRPGAVERRGVRWHLASPKPAPEDR